MVTLTGQGRALGGIRFWFKLFEQISIIREGALLCESN